MNLNESMNIAASLICEDTDLVSNAEVNNILLKHEQLLESLKTVMYDGYIFTDYNNGRYHKAYKCDVPNAKIHLATEFLESKQDYQGRFKGVDRIHIDSIDENTKIINYTLTEGDELLHHETKYFKKSVKYIDTLNGEWTGDYWGVADFNESINIDNYDLGTEHWAVTKEAFKDAFAKANVEWKGEGNQSKGLEMYNVYSKNNDEFRMYYQPSKDRKSHTVLVNVVEAANNPNRKTSVVFTIPGSTIKKEAEIMAKIVNRWNKQGKEQFIANSPKDSIQVIN